MCISSSLIARRTEFIHETNRIRGDYDNGISHSFLGCLRESHVLTHKVTGDQTHTHTTVCKLKQIQKYSIMFTPTQAHVQPLVSNRSE